MKKKNFKVGDIIESDGIKRVIREITELGYNTEIVGEDEPEETAVKDDGEGDN